VHHPSPETFHMPDADVILYRQAFHTPEGEALLQEFLQTIAWKQERLTVYGRVIDSPRLTAWYGDPGKVYRYSGIALTPHPWTPALLQVKERVEALAHVPFNSVLLNLYRHERDSVAWHSDAEPELGSCPVIGSVSFGATRRFQLRHKYDRTLRQNVDLPHGSVLVMRGPTQHYWQHCVPKASTPQPPRVNLTFRSIME
jgi:alkylated DNA repair dioxygenase AlkB